MAAILKPLTSSRRSHAAERESHTTPSGALILPNVLYVNTAELVDLNRNSVNNEMGP